MRKASLFTLILLGLVSLLFSACGIAGGNASDPAGRAVEDYINALVAKDAGRLSALSCANWEPSALLELDSFQAVAIRLDGLACQTSGADGDFTLVTCQGKIIATYNDEDQDFDLSVRTYQVVDQSGEYLVCGYR